MRRARGLKLAFVLLVLVATATGYAAYRRHQLRLRSFSGDLAVKYVAGTLGIEFVGGDEGLAILHHAYPDVRGEIRSTESGKLVRNVAGMMAIDAQGAVFARQSPRTNTLELADGWTGAARQLGSWPAACRVLAVSPGRDLVAIVTSYTTLEVRSLEGRVVSTCELKGSPLVDARLSPNGELVAAQGVGPRDRTVSLVSVASSTVVERISSARIVGFAKTGELVVGANDSSYAVRPGAHRLLTHEIDAIAIAAGGTRIAVEVKGESPLTPIEIHVLDIETGAILRKLKLHPGPVHALALSPDGDKLAVLFEDGSIEIWEIP